MEPAINYALKIASTLSVKAMSESYRYYKNRKFEKFSEFINLAVDTLTEEDSAKLAGYLKSYEGIKMTTECADAIAATISDTARMAIALALLHDPDYPMTESERRQFVIALKDKDDDVLLFFLDILTLREKLENNGAYPRAGISSRDIGKFGDGNWSPESVYAYCNELIRSRLILPDPNNYAGLASTNGGWGIHFGITQLSRKYGGLIRKARLLVSHVKD